MKFKSIKELEKERKELDVDNLTTQVMEIELKAKLEQTKEIAEMIEEDIKITEDGIRKWKDDRDETIRLNSQLATSKHFLAEIKGEEI